VKYYVFLFAAIAGAQSVTTNYATDLNGNRVADGSVISTDGTQTRTTRSINGSQVPMEQTEVHVLSKTPDSTVTETIIHKYDQDGHVTGTERILTEQRKQASGETVHVTTFRSDINGSMQQAERRTTESTTQGNVTKTQTSVEESTPNGFETVEKRTAVSESKDGSTHSEQTVYRRTENGTFDPAFQTVTDTTRTQGKTVEKTAQYQPIGDVNRMQLTKQTVNTTTERPDGSSVSQLDYYGAAVPGNVRDPGAAQQLYERDTIERKPGAGGSVVETLTAQRASMSNPSQLGPPIPISQTVCTGDCKNPPAPGNQ